MKGDIAFVGFMLTADEWQELDAQSRAQLIAVATRQAEPFAAESRPRRFPDGTGKHEIIEALDAQLDELIEPIDDEELERLGLEVEIEDAIERVSSDGSVSCGEPVSSDGSVSCGGPVSSDGSVSSGRPVSFDRSASFEASVVASSNAARSVEASVASSSVVALEASVASSTLPAIEGAPAVAAMIAPSPKIKPAPRTRRKTAKTIERVSDAVLDEWFAFQPVVDCYRADEWPELPVPMSVALPVSAMPEAPAYEDFSDWNF